MWECLLWKHSVYIYLSVSKLFQSFFSFSSLGKFFIFEFAHKWNISCTYVNSFYVCRIFLCLFTLFQNERNFTVEENMYTKTIKQNAVTTPRCECCIERCIDLVITIRECETPHKYYLGEIPMPWSLAWIFSVFTLINNK